MSTRELRAEDVPDLYGLYLKSMQSFGSPPYNTQFFMNFLELGMGKIFGAFFEGKLVAALVGYCYQKRIHVIISISDEVQLQHRPNDAMHWAFIKYGCEQGYELFDFGLTREGSGQHEYKEKFGSQMHPYHQYYLLLKKKEIPRIDPTDKKWKFAVAVWKQMPLCISRRIGPWLRAGLGI